MRAWSVRRLKTSVGWRIQPAVYEQTTGKNGQKRWCLVATPITDSWSDTIAGLHDAEEAGTRLLSSEGPYIRGLRHNRPIVKLSDLLEPEEEAALRLGAPYMLGELATPDYFRFWLITTDEHGRKVAVRQIPRTFNRLARNTVWNLGIRITQLSEAPPTLEELDKRAEIAAALNAREAERTAARAARQAAKNAPEAKRARKLAKTQDDLKRWQRKLKLATTKIKKLTRQLKRLA